MIQYILSASKLEENGRRQGGKEIGENQARPTSKAKAEAAQDEVPSSLFDSWRWALLARVQQFFLLLRMDACTMNVYQ